MMIHLLSLILSTTAADCQKYPSNKAKLLAGVTDFFQATTYPDNVAQANLINSTWFTSSTVGRADITNVFTGQELNTEYVFGLFASIATDTTLYNTLGAPVSAVPQTLILSDTSLVSVSALFTIVFSKWGLDGKVDMLADFNFDFDECNRVRGYDLRFPRFAWAEQQVRQLARIRAGKVLKIPVERVTERQIDQVQDSALIESICGVHEKYCTGGMKEYASKSKTLSWSWLMKGECRKFLKGLPTGQSWEYGGNTKNCRGMHQNMLPRRPSVHCPHIGKSGGEMCIDREYEQVITSVPFDPPMMNLE